ncbi:MAG: hypothetical protein NT062_18225, partial [Proteobacteria bacterium]|nr:hypothetical protein [Pseudomonadota bacterium]
MKTIAFDMFPEGGDLVEGVPGRVYFMARNTLGKPADLEGKIVDDRGTVVGELASIHDGMGRFELSPQADRTYHVEVTRPAGIAQRFAVPAAKAGGCVVRSVGDHGDKLRVAAICSTTRTVLVEAILRETRIAGGAVEVQAGKPALVELPVDAHAQGAVRVTLFSTKQEPLAERLVYHGRGQDLQVAVTAEKTSYAPRDPVKLKVRATDAAGKPVKASLGVAVVDDTVLSFADDKSGKLLARLYLEPELGVNPTDPATAIEEPNYYFSPAADAPAALDALLATRGYRRFEWAPVFAPPPPPRPQVAYEDEMAGMPADWPMAPEAVEAPRPMRRPMARGPKVAEAPRAVPVVQDKKRAHEVNEEKPRADLERKRPPAMIAKQDVAQGGARGRAMRDDAWDGDEDGVAVAWAPTRVFPMPSYTPAYAGPRTDFRETIYWNPNVETNADGTAEVAFFASDAITSFRATVEGVSAGGVPGGGDVVFQAKMPVSLDAHLPVEVTQGDQIQLPVTIANETDRVMDAELSATFGAAFKLGANPSGTLHLAAHAKQTVMFPLQVVATDGEAKVELKLATAGLSDQLTKTIRVVPLGFPFEVAASGTAVGGKPMTHAFALDGALPGSITASVTMYPSPLAAMTTGMAAMIREPGGCFEQTSSTNYPNIMILSYLDANDKEGKEGKDGAADPALIARTQGVLDRGYKLLTGYETKNAGYEWFGQNPGHEALTAYGLMEFADMGKVYDVDGKMVERTAAWLMSRRDGKGGFARSSQALDSFGRASEPTTNAYIMWALAEAGRTTGMTKELAQTVALGATTKDAYLLALATNTAIVARAPEAAALTRRLVEQQAADGSFPNARESITMSGGESLAIEATSLATLALIKASPANEYEPQIRRAVDFLNAKRGGYGQWSNTQATILGLKALTAYADHARQMAAP